MALPLRRGLLDDPLQLGAPNTIAEMMVGRLRCTKADVKDPWQKEECGRLTTFANQRLDEASHAPVVSVAVYQDPPPGPSTVLHTFGGYADFAIVAFRLSDGTNQAFYVSCGARVAKELCFDLRPFKPGEWTGQEPSNPNPMTVP